MFYYCLFTSVEPGKMVFAGVDEFINFGWGNVNGYTINPITHPDGHFRVTVDCNMPHDEIVKWLVDNNHIIQVKE